MGPRTDQEPEVLASLVFLVMGGNVGGFLASELWVFCFLDVEENSVAGTLDAVSEPILAPKMRG